MLPDDRPAPRGRRRSGPGAAAPESATVAGGCHDRPMPASSAELSSLATALDELTRRVTVHAEAADAAKDEETARELFAIERSLASANRRLARLALTLSAADRQGRPPPGRRERPIGRTGRPGRGEGTPKGAFAEAGRAADPDPYSAEPVGGNWSASNHITDLRTMPVIRPEFLQPASQARIFVVNLRHLLRISSSQPPFDNGWVRTRADTCSTWIHCRPSAPGAAPAATGGGGPGRRPSEPAGPRPTGRSRPAGTRSQRGDRARHVARRGGSAGG